MSGRCGPAGCSILLERTFQLSFRVARAENERRTCLIMSSRETSMPSGPVAPMVNPPKGKPLKAIFEATLGGRARENARMRRVGKGKDEKKKRTFRRAK